MHLGSQQWSATTSDYDYDVGAEIEQISSSSQISSQGLATVTDSGSDALKMYQPANSEHEKEDAAVMRR